MKTDHGTVAVVRFADKDGREWEVDMACPSNYTGASCMVLTVPVVYPRKAPNEAGPEVSATHQVADLIGLMVGLVVCAVAVLPHCGSLSSEPAGGSEQTRIAEFAAERDEFIA